VLTQPLARALCPVVRQPLAPLQLLLQLLLGCLLPMVQLLLLFQASEGQFPPPTRPTSCSNLTIDQHKAVGVVGSNEVRSSGKAWDQWSGNGWLQQQQLTKSLCMLLV